MSNGYVDHEPPRETAPEAASEEARASDAPAPDWYRPPRGYRWAPFAPGNTAGQRHGAYSPRRVDPLARELANLATAHAGYLAEPSYAPAVWAWARAEARVQLLAEWLDEHGPLDADGNPRPALAALTQQERLAAEGRQRLGLDPLSRARLGRDVAAGQVDLAALFARLEANVAREERA